MKDTFHVSKRFFLSGFVFLASSLFSIAQTAQVQWENSSVTFDESSGTVSLTLVRTGELFGPKTVTYSTVQLENSATSGSDFFPATGLTKILPSNVAEVEVQITINQDFIQEPSESFLVSLSTFDPTLTIGGNKDITVTISDDDGSTGGDDVLIEWADTVVRVSEDASTAELNVVRSGGLNSAVSVSYETSIDPGSEISFTDFQSVTGSLNFPAGVTQRSIPITINNDSLTEPEEEFQVTLSNISSGSIGTKNPVRVIIEDDESVPGVVGWNVTEIETVEGETEVQLEIQRVGGTQGSISVRYESASGTATSGSDFTAVSGIINWIHGSNTSRVVTVPILDDGLMENSETFDLVLSSVIGEVELSNATVSVTIEDNDDISSSGAASFVEPSVSVDESVGTISVDVSRAGGSGGELMIGYSFTDSSAMNGSDYTGIDGNLTWQDGDVENKQILIPIIDDGDADSGETFFVTLSAADASLLGQQTTFTVTVEDSDISTPGTVTFVTANQTVDESEGIVSVWVQRIGGATGQVTVNFETVEGTALEAVDYLASLGTLTWEDGDSSNKEIRLTLVNDEFYEGNESFFITLADIAGGNVAGANSSHEVVIQDDESEPETWFEFKRVLYSGTESAERVQIEVERFGAGVGDASVFVRSEDLSGKVWEDYVLMDEEMSWLDGELGVKSTVLTVIDDQNPEPSEWVRVFLEDPSDNALVGDVSNASALIYDDDTPTGNLVNLSTRGYVGSGAEALIGGFIIRGGSQRLLIRAVGPSLAGLEGVVQDPALQIVDNSTQELIFENDNWTEDPDQIEPIIATGLGGLNLFESALLIELPEGSYSALVSANTEPGIGSIEIYIDSSAQLPGSLLNISTRGKVTAGDEILIGGLIVRGDDPKRVLLRGVGPSLIIPGAPSLPDPELILYDETGQEVLRNNNWLEETNWDEIEATLLAPMDIEAAMLFEVDPGSYTIHLRSVGEESGIGLVEIYSLN